MTAQFFAPVAAPQHPRSAFADRHIGPGPDERARMLAAIRDHYIHENSQGRMEARNRTIQKLKQRLEAAVHLKTMAADAHEEFRAAMLNADPDVVSMYAGQGVGALRTEQPAAEVIASFAKAVE